MLIEVPWPFNIWLCIRAEIIHYKKWWCMTDSLMTGDAANCNSTLIFVHTYTLEIPLIYRQNLVSRSSHTIVIILFTQQLLKLNLVTYSHKLLHTLSLIRLQNYCYLNLNWNVFVTNNRSLCTHLAYQ